MDQVSLPYRIAFVALLVVGALWFVALRPKSEPATTAPGVTGLANDVDKAKDAVSSANSGATSGDASSTSATGTTGANATPGSSSKAPDLLAGVGFKDPSRSVLEAVQGGRVAVMLFWNSKAADDRAVRRAVLALDRRDGKVLIRVTSISRVGRYEAITRAARIEGSPTVLIINRRGVARTIVGYTTTPEIDQLVRDLGGKGF